MRESVPLSEGVRDDEGDTLGVRDCDRVPVGVRLGVVEGLQPSFSAVKSSAPASGALLQDRALLALTHAPSETPVPGAGTCPSTPSRAAYHDTGTSA